MQKLNMPKPAMQRRMWHSIEYRLWDSLVIGKITGEEMLAELILGTCDDLVDERLASGEITMAQIEEWSKEYRVRSDFAQCGRRESHKGRDSAEEIRDCENFSRQGTGLRARPIGKY